MHLRELRHRANLRVIDVAYQLDVSETTIRNWETGRTVPKLRYDQFRFLAKLYNCSADALFDAIDESQAKAQRSQTTSETDPASKDDE